MTIILHDLSGVDDRRFSPNTWRTRMAVAHKGLDCDARGTHFVDIPSICGGGQKTVPVIEDNDTVVADSWAIAQYLEDTYPDRPSLFDGNGGRTLTAVFQNWVMTEVYAKLAPMIILDILNHVDDGDKDYFRTSREKRFGKTLEDIQSSRDEKVGAFQAGFAPIRLTLKSQNFIGGDGPLYADYILFAALQWARVSSDFTILEKGDAVLNWFDRCLDLYDGLGRSEKGYW